MAVTRPVRFVFRKLNTGSTVMRAHQLCQIANRFSREPFEFALSEFPHERDPDSLRGWVDDLPRDAILFFTKHAVKMLNGDLYDMLGARGCRVIVDCVDSVIDRLPFAHADLVVSSTYDGYRAMIRAVDDGLIDAAHRDKMALVLHAADIKVYGLGRAQSDCFSTAYLGAPENFLLPEALGEDVTYLKATNPRLMRKSLKVLNNYSFHYGVRPTAGPEARIRSYKPFTKGVTAAHCGAPILINRDVDDATIFLSDSYPFFVDDGSDGDISRAFAHARDAFGGPEWRYAQSIMQSVAARTSPPEITRQLCDALHMV